MLSYSAITHGDRGCTEPAMNSAAAIPTNPFATSCALRGKSVAKGRRPNTVSMPRWSAVLQSSPTQQQCLANLLVNMCLTVQLLDSILK